MAAGSRSFTNTCNGNHGSHYTQTLTVNWGDYDIPNNRTYVWINYSRTRESSSYYNYGYANPSQISIDGSQVASATPTSAHNQYATQTLCTWEGWIYHNNDGTKSINVSASFSSTSSNLSGGSVSGTVQLPTIPRASSISATSVDIGSNTTISINRASTSFTHTITYQFGSLSGTIATKTNNTPISWTVPTTFYAQIPNSKNGTCTLTCVTYSGDTQIGTSSTTFTATANETLCKPDLSGNVLDILPATISLTGESSKLVKYRSTAQITTSATAKNSATISSIKINGVVGASRIIEKVETNVFEIIATDSRGYSKTINIQCTMVDYIPLTASSTFKRISNTSDKVNLTYSGNYWNGAFGVENNTLSLTYKYREKGSETWINGTSSLSPTIQDNKFNATLELTEDFNYRKNWEFSLFYVDKLTNSNTGINNVLKGNGAFEIYENAIKIFGNNLFEFIYPVGSIYISTNNVNPHSLFGIGTWESFGTGRTLVGVDANQTEFNVVEKTGGSKYLQQHRHTMTSYYDDANYNTGTIPNDYGAYSLPYDAGDIVRHQYTDFEGNGDSGNLQPYITVYMWKRVS